MKVLVSAASKHGGTILVADAIADELRAAGLDVESLEPERVGDVSRYDAVVLGSAIYMGRWLRSAKELVRRQDENLRGRWLWLFSSGPLGDPLTPAEVPEEVASLAAYLGARDHHLFGGRLDRSRLGLAERAILAATKAPEGDFRALDDVRAWANGIAAELVADRA
jgi:menaquinone-dependent protoporphyrinogen oxidase